MPANRGRPTLSRVVPIRDTAGQYARVGGCNTSWCCDCGVYDGEYSDVGLLVAGYRFVRIPTRNRVIAGLSDVLLVVEQVSRAVH